MASVNGPLFSLRASGNLKKLLVYTRGKAGAVVKGNRLEKQDTYSFRIKPYFSETRDQLAVRENFKNATENWMNLTEEQKDEYKAAAQKIKNTGVGLFVQEYMETNYSEDEYRIYWLFGVGAGHPLFLIKKGFMTGAMLAIGVNK